MSYEQYRWAEAAPRWSLEQSAAEHYWRSHQRVEKKIESVRACRWTTFWTFIVKACDWYLFLKRCSFTAELVIFRVLKFPKVRYVQQNTSGGILNHLSKAYLLCNESDNIVEIIVDGWVVSFIDTQCIYRFMCTCVLLWQSVYTAQYINL